MILVRYRRLLVLERVGNIAVIPKVSFFILPLVNIPGQERMKRTYSNYLRYFLMIHLVPLRLKCKIVKKETAKSALSFYLTILQCNEIELKCFPCRYSM